MFCPTKPEGGFYISFCFDYNGSMTTRGMTEEDVERATALFDDAFFDNWTDGAFNDDLTFGGFCKYHNELIGEFFRFISPFVTTGEITCEGEDGGRWKYVYNYGRHMWEEYQGETYYPRSDQKLYWLTEEDRGLILALLMNVEPAGMEYNDRKRLRELKEKFGRDTG